jgi:hypothetical protein
MRREIVFILLMVLLAGLVQASFHYDLVSLPFAANESVFFTGIPGDNISWNCTRVDLNSTCIYTMPGFFNYSFPPSNFSNETNVTLNVSVLFNVFVPNGIINSQILERYDFYRNGLIDDFLSFNINVSIPPPANPNSSIVINQISPANGSGFNMFSTLPVQVIVNYSGIINWSRSNMMLLYNGSNVSWINRTLGDGGVVFRLGQVPDGVYSGNWILYDNVNNSLALEYSYYFVVKTVKPPMPVEVYPAKGRYANDVLQLLVRLDSINYGVFYIVKDSVPGYDDSWTIVPVLSNSFVIQNFDFGNQGLGALYLKIIDEVGNYRITPTGVISSPSFSVSLDDRIRSVDLGDRTVISGRFVQKKGSGSSFSCRMKDFSSGNRSWSVRGRVRIIFDKDTLEIEPVYSDSVAVDASEDFDMEIDIPDGNVANDDYTSNLECVLR